MTGEKAEPSAAVVTGVPFAIVCLVGVAGLRKTFRERYENVVLQATSSQTHYVTELSS